MVYHSLISVEGARIILTNSDILLERYRGSDANRKVKYFCPLGDIKAYLSWLTSSLTLLLGLLFTGMNWIIPIIFYFTFITG